MRFVHSKPTTFKAILLAGALILSLGDAQAAPATYTQTIEAARVQFNAGDYAGAQKTTEEALLLAQTPEEKSAALLRIGLTFIKRQMVPQAREQWAKIFQLPGNTDREKVTAQATIAASFAEQEDWDTMRTEFQKLLDMPGASAQDKGPARLAIAISYLNQRKDPETRREFAAVAEDAGLDLETRAAAYLHLGQYLVGLKEFDEARTTFRKALNLIATTPSLLAPSIQAMIAESLKAQGNLEQAQAEFEKAQVEALKRVPWFHDRKDYAAERDLLNLVLTSGKVDPVLDANVSVQGGHCFVEESKPAEAIKPLEEFLEKDYGTDLTVKDKTTIYVVRQTAQLELAKAYLQQKNNLKARELLTSLLATPELIPQVKAGADNLLKTLTQP